MNVYLVHHGIKGQKWGIRRYQNEDGSLTEAGKKRYARYKELEKSNLFYKLDDKHREEYDDIKTRFHEKIAPYDKKFNEATAGIKKRQEKLNRQYQEAVNKIKKKAFVKRRVSA